MADTKYTPGPWAVEADGDDNFRIVQVIEFDGEPPENGDCICSVPGLELSTDCDEANANLIAAVPELYEAAEKVLAWWDQKLANELSSNRDFAWAEDAEWSEFRAMRAALAKARGEPS